MRYCMHITVNYPDGSEGHIVANPKHLEDLKGIIGAIVVDEKSASSFVFCIVAQPRGEKDDRNLQ